MDNVKAVNSMLALKRLVFENIQYVCTEVDFTKFPEYEMNFTRTIQSIDNENYKVSLSANVWSKEDKKITLVVTLAGYFVCQTDDENVKNALINENAIAILFPYLRSQVSLVTTQPNLSPIIIPPVNIVAMFHSSQDQENNN